MASKFILPLSPDKGFTISRNGDSLRIFDKGGATKTGLALVPGWACPAGYYQKQVPFFETRYSVSVRDNQGVEGTPLKTGPKEYIAANATDWAELLRMARFDSIHLVGHSMGAEIAVMIASEYGKELNVRTVTLIAPVVKDPIETLPEGRIGTVSRMLANSIRRQIEKDGGISEKVCAKVRIFLQLGRAADATRMLMRGEVTRRTNIEFWNYALAQDRIAVATAMEGMRLAGSEVTERLARLEVPVLIIGAKEDQLVSSESVVQLFRLPVVKHGEMLAGTTHFPHIERPDIVNHLIQSFIKRMEARA